MDRPSLSRRLHNRIWTGCDHSICAHGHERRAQWRWWAFCVAMNLCGLVWHLIADRRLVTDHVARSWRYYRDL